MTLRVALSLSLSLTLVACAAEVGDGTLEADVLVPGDVGRSVSALTTERQLVYLHFDDITIRDCDSYCSDAPTNRSWAISGHFGVSSKSFARYRGDRADVARRVRAIFEGYRLDVVTARPATGPYSMVVISESSGPNHGVAPLDCGNRNPSDIAFVYRIGGSSTRWIAQAVAHELGHSFGLDHVVGRDAIMHPDSTGTAFRRDRFHSSRMSTHCVAGDVQDAPAYLRETLSGPASCAEVDRAAGPSRFETAVAVSRRTFARAESAVIVSGEDRSTPDALAAGPLAHRLGGPLLLVGSNALPSATADELRRLGVRTAYVIGGAGAVSEDVAAAIRGRGHQVVRLAGPTRFGTAAEVAREVGARDGLAFIASGADANLVDALAAAGPAAALGAPVLLVTRDSIPGETRAALAELGVRRTLVAGGPAAISDSVLRGLPSPTRLSGPSRYETAAAVARHAIERLGVDPTHAWIGRGDVMVDALSAAAAGEITLLSPRDALHPAASTVLEDHVGTATLLGGQSALGTEVNRGACASLRR